jgi:hypothetical protein
MLPLSDLMKVILSMANENAPRCDEFPYKFYKTLWDVVGPDLHKVYIEAFHSQSLGRINNKGNIKSITKSGDPKDICN